LLQREKGGVFLLHHRRGKELPRTGAGTPPTGKGGKSGWKEQERTLCAYSSSPKGEREGSPRLNSAHKDEKKKKEKKKKKWCNSDFPLSVKREGSKRQSDQLRRKTLIPGGGGKGKASIPRIKKSSFCPKGGNLEPLQSLLLQRTKGGGGRKALPSGDRSVCSNMVRGGKGEEKKRHKFTTTSGKRGKGPQVLSREHANCYRR